MSDNSTERPVPTAPCQGREGAPEGMMHFSQEPALAPSHACTTQIVKVPELSYFIYFIDQCPAR